MKEHRPEDHLSYDELLRALVQGTDLPAQKLAHLQACPTCRQALARAEARFRGIGKMARKMAPDPPRSFRLPARRPAPAARFKRLGSLLAAGAAVALILVAATWTARHLTPAPVPSTVAVSTLEQDRRLMQEVDALVDNALPDAYQRLAAFSEPVFDEDLINWIVPSIEEDDNSLT